MFRLTGFMRASSGSVAPVPSILNLDDMPLWSSRTSAALNLKMVVSPRQAWPVIDL